MGVVILEGYYYYLVLEGLFYNKCKPWRKSSKV